VYNSHNSKASYTLNKAIKTALKLHIMKGLIALFIKNNSKIEGFIFRLDFKEGIYNVEKVCRHYNYENSDVNSMLKELKKEFRKATKTSLFNGITFDVTCLENETLKHLGFRRYVLNSVYNGKVELKIMTAPKEEYSSSYDRAEESTYSIEELNHVINRIFKDTQKSITEIEDNLCEPSSLS
jgi:hypothetical protein